MRMALEHYKRAGICLTDSLCVRGRYFPFGKIKSRDSQLERKRKAQIFQFEKAHLIASTRWTFHSLN